MTVAADDIDWDKGGGLVPAVVQDADDGRVLMLGYMNREALAATAERRKVTFFSRSRQALWQKGETSGNVLHLVDVTADCDGDTLLVRARPAGPVCHLGTPTCFAEAGAGLGFLGELEAIIDQRFAAGDETSYVAGLKRAGTRRMAQKVGEEGVEVALAATAGDGEETVDEAADLLFHVAVLLRAQGLSLADVVARLRDRHR